MLTGVNVGYLPLIYHYVIGSKHGFHQSVTQKEN